MLASAQWRLGLLPNHPIWVCPLKIIKPFISVKINIQKAMPIYMKYSPSVMIIEPQKQKKIAILPLGNLMQICNYEVVDAECFAKIFWIEWSKTSKIFIYMLMSELYPHCIPSSCPVSTRYKKCIKIFFLPLRKHNNLSRNDKTSPITCLFTICRAYC